jgi:uncharacterized membrane protein SirB2
MANFHPQLRALHIACAYLSLALFVLRHVLNLRNVDWRRWRSLRIMPHVVDTLLLLSAVGLATSMAQYPLVNAWLTVKVAALVVYIGLAMVALSQRHTQAVRRMAFLAAVVVFAFILSVARSRSPLGVLAQWG